MFGITIMKYSRYRELLRKLHTQETEIERLRDKVFELINKNAEESGTKFNI